MESRNYYVQINLENSRYDKSYLLCWSILGLIGDNRPYIESHGILSPKDSEKIISRLSNNDFEFVAYFFMTKAKIVHSQVTVLLCQELEEKLKFLNDNS